MNKKFKSILEILLVIILFIVFSYCVRKNMTFFEDLIGMSYIGMILYVILNIIAIVIAPISTFPLIVVASNIYGWVIAAFLSILSWSIGAAIAFVIARKYGVPLVSKIFSLKKIKEIEKKVPKNNLFLSVVFLRMAVPVDVLSYALGLFSRMKFRTYILATIIGVSPFAFIFSYAGTLPVMYQIFALVIGLSIFILGIILNKKLKR